MESELLSVLFSVLPPEVVRVLAYLYVASFVFNLVIDRYAPHTDVKWLEWMRSHPRAAGVVSFLRAFPGHPAGMVRSLLLIAVRRKPDAILEAVAAKLPAPPPLPTVLLVIAAGAAGLSQTACSSAGEAMRMVRVSSDIIAAAEPCLVSAYELELRHCLEQHADVAAARACGDAVDTRWEASKEAFDTLRDLRCALEPAKCASAVQ